MDNDIITFCKLFYASTYIPVVYYNKDGVPEFKIPSLPVNLAANFSKTTWSEITKTKKNPDYFISDKTYAAYGSIRLDRTSGYIVFGPVYDTSITSTMVTEFVKENQISISLKAEVATFLQNIPIKNHFQFINQLIFLNFSLNKKQVNLEDYIYLDNNINNDISSTHTEQIIQRKETSDFHNTYLLEQEMLSYIRRGEKEKLNKFLMSSAKKSLFKEGILATTPLRQAKNIFLASLTKVGNSGAIKGGMDVEEAYQLMDLYSQECERLNDIKNIRNLNLIMVEDFCERVSQRKLPNERSKEVFICMNFINNSTNIPIQVADVANHVGKSISYISKKFSDEVGASIGSYIMESKLEDAKHLLLYSNNSLSEISSYLCFSSQSYFQNVFKKKYGITPAKFRNTSL